MNHKDLHYVLNGFGVVQATLVLESEDDWESYEYTWIDPSEYQFGRVGDVPTNYVVEPGQVIVS